jgi:hypothetical protein
VTQTRARHILMRPTEQLRVEQAQALPAEYRCAQIESGARKFEDVARSFSEDGSAARAVTWAGPRRATLVPEFEEAMNRLPHRRPVAAGGLALRRAPDPGAGAAPDRRRSEAGARTGARNACASRSSTAPTPTGCATCAARLRRAARAAALSARPASLLHRRASTVGTARPGRHVARKRFGQHFLTDAVVIDAASCEAIDPRPGQALVEIGPGLGAMTGRCCERCGALTVIELDRDLAARCAASPGCHGGRGRRADGRLRGAGRRRRRQPLRMVGNLPYNISTPILFHLLPVAPTGCSRPARSCCRRRWSSAWPPRPAARTTGA